MKSEDQFHRFGGTSEIRQDLRRRAVRAFGYVLTSSAGEFVLRIGSTAILARLLVPEHFGLFMMTTAVTAIADQFRDLGLSTATIQREEITHQEVSNLFWINAAAGLLVAAVVCGCAPFVADYYQEPRLGPITMILSLNFLLGGLTVQHEALMTRQMRHGRKALVRLLAFILSSVLAIVMALHGSGYWALVWREVVRSALIMIGAWLVCPWLPGLPDRRTDVRGLLSFGKDLTAAFILNTISASTDRLLLGRFFGPGPVALYRQPYQLVVAPVNQFMSPLYQVSLPGLSMLQSSPERFRRFYHRIAAVVALASMPLSLFLAIYAPEITRIVLGHQWTGAAVFFRIFALGGLLRAVASIPGFVLVSRGKSKPVLLLCVANSVVMVSLMCLGVHWGPTGVAVAEVATICVMFLPNLIVSFKDSPVTIASFLSALVRPAVSTLLMGAALILFRNALPQSSPLVSVLLGALPAACVLLLAWMVLPGGRAEFQELASSALAAVRRRSAPDPVG